MFITHQNVPILHIFLYYEEGRWHFFEKMNILWTPLFQNSFFQNRLAHLHTNFELDRTIRFERNNFFVKKLTIFKKSKLSQLSRHWRVSAFNGRYQSIRHTLYYRKVLCLWFHLFSFLKNDQFFTEKVSKSFKKCLFSSKLRDFSY